MKLVAGVAALCLFAAGAARADVSLVVPSANLTAPAAVWSIGSGTTCGGFMACADSWLDLDYEHDFGDDPNAVHLDGLPKNVEHGPNALHIYQTPGTYQIHLRVRDALGTVRDAVSAPFTVVDAASVFSTANTRCFAATAGTFQGCPLDTNGDGTCDVSAGNCLVGSSVFLNNFQGSSVRLMFRRGTVFTLASGMNLNGAATTGPLWLGAFGTGAIPELHFPGPGNGGNLFNVATPPLRLFTMTSIKVSRDNPSNGSFFQSAGMDRTTFEGVEIVGGTGGILFDGCKVDNCFGVAVANSKWTAMQDNWAVLGNGTRVGLVNLDLDMPSPAVKQSHCLRFSGVRQLNIQHVVNRCFGRFNGINVRSGSYDPAKRSEEIVITDVSSTMDSWATPNQHVQLSSTSELPNDISQGDMSRCLVERVSTSGGRNGIMGACSNWAARSNTVDLSNVANGTGITAGGFRPELTSYRLMQAVGFSPGGGLHDVRIHNNRIFCTPCVGAPDAGTPGGSYAIFLNQWVHGVVLSNNLYEGVGLLPLANNTAEVLSVAETRSREGLGLFRDLHSRFWCEPFLPGPESGPCN